MEALAQVGAVAILSEEENRGKVAYFGGINSAKFRKKGSSGGQTEAGMPDYQEKGAGWNWKCDSICGRQSGSFRRAHVYDWIGDAFV